MTDIDINPKNTEIDVTISRIGGGTSDYAELNNKPSINGVELVGNKTTADLGIEVDTSNLATKEELGNYASNQDVAQVLQIITQKIDSNTTNIQDLNTKVDGLPTVPTKTSELENDSLYVTQQEIVEVMQLIVQQIQTNTTNITDIQNQIGNIETALSEV